MTIKLHHANFIHALALVGQILNAVSGIVPQKYQVFVSAGIAAVQLGVGKLQQNTPVPPVQ